MIKDEDVYAIGIIRSADGSDGPERFADSRQLLPAIDSKPSIRKTMPKERRKS